MNEAELLLDLLFALVPRLRPMGAGVTTTGSTPRTRSEARLCERDPVHWAWVNPFQQVPPVLRTARDEAPAEAGDTTAMPCPPQDSVRGVM